MQIEKLVKQFFSSKISVFIYAVLFFCLLYILCDLFKIMNSYYPAYVIVAIFSIFCFFINNFLTSKFITSTKNSLLLKINKIADFKLNKKDWILIIIFTIIFTAIIILGNFHTTFEKSINVKHIILNFTLAPLGIMLIWEEILRFFIKLSHVYSSKKRPRNNKTWHLLLILWTCIGAIYLLNLIFVNYPGIINPDASKQINQIISGHYSNHYSFWITIIMKIFLDFGQLILGNYNIGIFMYSVFQLIILSLSFALMLTTIYKIGVPNYLIILLTIWFCIMPYHIIMSNTLYTDTLFTASCIFMTIFIFRIFKKIGNSKANIVFVIISSLCVCLFRPNGIYVLIASAIFLLLMFWKRKDIKSLKISISAVALASIIMFNPVLDILKVEKTDIINHISIPTQQITKVLIDNNDLDSNQINMINNVADINKIKQLYKPGNFDSIKFYIREQGNQEFIRENIFQFIAMYIDIGLKHPFEYLIAWTDLTNDYWNAQQDQMPKHSKQYLNLGINIDQLKFNEVSNLWNTYNNVFYYYIGLLQSIGFHFWLFLIALFIVLSKGDKAIIYTFIPCMFVIISVIIASPVQWEIRYLYPMFCLLPFLWIIAFQKFETREI